MIKQDIKKWNWFTLVELIIMVTILSVLATIWFMSFWKYTKNSRDSNRLMTVNNVEKSLNLYQIELQKYPKPENISWTWTINWKELVYVWEIWDRLSRTLKIHNIPLDPLTWDKYVYWISSEKNKFQIATIQEWEELWYNLLINKTYAAWENYTSKVSGNYEWIIKYNSWWTCIANIPSLLFATWWEIDLISEEAWFIVDKEENLPYLLSKAWKKIKKTNKEILEKVSNTWSITYECLSNEKAWEEEIKTNPFKYEVTFWHDIEKVWKESIWKDRYKEIKYEVIEKIKEEKWNLWISNLPQWNYTIPWYSPLFEPILYNYKIYFLTKWTLKIATYDINTQEISEHWQISELKQCSSTNPKDFVKNGNLIFFRLCETQYWSDYKIASYNLINNTFNTLTQINTTLSNFSNLFAFKGYLYFAADDGIVWKELWRYNPLNNILERITDINTTWSSFPNSLYWYFTIVWEKIYFKADNWELWKKKIFYYDTKTNLVNSVDWYMKTITWGSTYRDVNASYWSLSNLWNWFLWYIPNYVNTTRIWYYNTNNDTATVVYDSNVSITPIQDKLLWIWNKIYFIWKDTNETYFNLYEYDKISNVYTKKTNLSGSIYSNTWNLMEKWGKIYFTNTNNWVWTLYEYDLSTSQLSIIDDNVTYYEIIKIIWDSLYYIKWWQWVRSKL